MAIPTNALPYFAEGTRSLDMFRNLRLNTDHTVSREEYQETKPFRAYVTYDTGYFRICFQLILSRKLILGCMSGQESRF